VGQKVNPTGFRVGITEGWSSRWYAPKANFGAFVVEDERVRRFVNDELNKKPPYAGVAKVEIERTRDEVKIILHTARPGVVIGAKGAEVDKLRERLEDLIERRVNVSIVEIKNPDINAVLVAASIAEQLKKRSSFRRVLKQKCEAAMNAGAKGVKVMVAGRLGGAEIARTEQQMLGSIPLQTLQADVDFARDTAVTTYGAIGIKVWVYRGRYGEEIVARPEGRFQRRARH
jgi:small subunit ribosomal protein S3